MNTRICALVAGLLAAMTAPPVGADTIELFSGEKVTEVKVDRIEGGFLYFSGKGKTGRVEGHKVKGWHPDVTADPCVLVKFKADEIRRGKGWLLQFAVNNEAERIREPYVRAMALTEDRNGQRALLVYASSRLGDPTRVETLQMVNTEPFRKKSYFLEAANKLTPVAWRIEVWLDGTLALQHEETELKDLAADWWRVTKVLRLVLLEDYDPAAKDKKQVGEVPPVTIRIGQTRIIERADKARVIFQLGYQIISGQVEDVRLPKATLYYVTENADHKQTIRTHVFKSASNAHLVKESYSYDDEFEFDPKLVLAATLNPDRERDTEKEREKEKERIICWRVEISYGEEVLAAKEGGNEKLLADLPKEWWK